MLPDDIPEHIDIDISELMLNQGVRVRDVHTEGAKWTPDQRSRNDDRSRRRADAPRSRHRRRRGAEAAAPTAAAEPEVMKKGKTDKEDEK